MTDSLHGGVPAYGASEQTDAGSNDDRAMRGPDSVNAQGLQEAPAAAQADTASRTPRRAWWRRPFGFLGRASRIRLPRSRVVRLLLAFGVIAVVMGIVAFGILRVIGARDKISEIKLPFVEEFTDVDVAKWLTRGGVWVLRQDSLSELANLNDQARLYLPYKIPAEQPYHISTYVIFGGSTRAAGVNFNAQYPDLTNKQHQVFIKRNEADAAEEGALPPPTMELVAGYTDDTGTFLPQVTVPFELDTQQYRLDVYVLGNSYTVQLNGQTMIERRPLFYPNGMVGFVTEGPGRFDMLRITTAQTREPGEQVYVSDFEQTPGGAGWVPLSGVWEVSDGELVQANPAAQDAAIGYEGSSFEDYVVQATFRHLVGVGGGLLFNMASPYQLNGSYIVRYSEQTDSVFWGFYDAKGMFTRQGYVETAPAGTEPHTLAVYVGIESYDVYLDDQLLVRNVPYQGETPSTEEGRSGGHIGLITSRSSVAYSLVEVFPLFDNAQMKLPKPGQVQTAAQDTAPRSADAPQPEKSAAPTAAVSPTPKAAATQAQPKDAATKEAEPPAPTAAAQPAPTKSPADAPKSGPTPLPPDSRLIESGSAAGWIADFRGDMAKAGWRPMNGQWRFANGGLVQSDRTGVDITNVYTGNAFQDYAYEASFTLGDGSAAGIVFNMPYTDRLNGAHLVRYSERRPGGIFWGYFNDEGKFIGQGYATVDPPADARHTMRVVSGTDKYSIYLDDFLLASGIPLMQNYGYVGVSTVQSTATFDNVAVQVAENVISAETPIAEQPLSAAGVYTGTDGMSDRRVVSGNWETEKGIYRQTAPNPADYLLNTGIYASNYRIEADILLPVKPEVGGGFMIHMPERGRKSGATVVRLTKGGDGLFWGAFDAAGGFRGRGSIDLPNKPEGDNVYHLLVDVRGGTMSISVDDEVVASDIVLPRGEGWIGLLAYGGPVTYSDLEISVEAMP